MLTENGKRRTENGRSTSGQSSSVTPLVSSPKPDALPLHNVNCQKTENRTSRRISHPSRSRIDRFFRRSASCAEPTALAQNRDLQTDVSSEYLKPPEASGFRLPSSDLRALRAPGGARRDRTDDLMLAKHALSQLSYGPVGVQRTENRQQIRTRPSSCSLFSVIPILVGLGGLEPPTSRLSSARSNQLSYKPVAEDGGRKTEDRRSVHLSFRHPCRPIERETKTAGPANAASDKAAIF